MRDSKVYVIQTEDGVYDVFDSFQEAVEVVRNLEKMDAEDGVYTQDYYTIVEC